MKLNYIAVLLAILFLSCTREPVPELLPSGRNGISVGLLKSGYAGENTRSASSPGRYDRLSYYFTGTDGDVIDNVRSYYDASSSRIYAEGLHEGSYRLIVLGIIGDESVDGAVVKDISSSGEVWLEFPERLEAPLEAEYFYSCTPFDVTVVTGDDGVRREEASLPGSIVQKRIVAGVDFSFSFGSRNVENSVVSKKVSLDGVRFCTSFSGDGNYGGSTDGKMGVIDLDTTASFIFMPVAEGSVLRGGITVGTENYRKEKVSLAYSFEQNELLPNHRHSVSTDVRHPDDALATMYVTERALPDFDISKILQDGEPKEIYTDRTQRMFNTSEPLQVSLSEDGRLHLRFYSPRDLKDVLLMARIPSLGDEYFDVAYFDVIPAFIDFYGEFPLFQKTLMVRTESGRYVEVDRMSPGDAEGISFRIVSDDEYWKKLEKIEHGWTIYWGLYGGDPEREDGGPVGNWMGIRPVHCRESVAMFINFTYMIDMPEHEAILHENADRLYDDNKQPVKVEEVLAKMRQSRTLQVGLVYPGNGVIGLGSPSVFGAYQRGWFEHYFNTYACSVMFHELGHVMGYGHSSSFTYGPWAEQLMNNFYVNNIPNFPIDSISYLDSANNPTRYK